MGLRQQIRSGFRRSLEAEVEMRVPLDAAIVDGDDYGANFFSFDDFHCSQRFPF